MFGPKKTKTSTDQGKHTGANSDTGRIAPSETTLDQMGAKFGEGSQENAGSEESDFMKQPSIAAAITSMKSKRKSAGKKAKYDSGTNTYR